MNALKTLVRAGAEGSTDPWWDDPSNEKTNLEKSLSVVRAHFEKDPRFLFSVTSSTKRSAVVYTLEDSNVKAEWVAVDDYDRKDYCSQHSVEDTGQLMLFPLNVLEQSYYGATFHKQERGVRIIRLRAFDQIEERGLYLQLVKDTSGSFACVAELRDSKKNNEPRVCRLQHAYIQCARGLFVDVDYINIYGVAIDNGDLVVECLTK